MKRLFVVLSVCINSICFSQSFNVEQLKDTIAKYLVGYVTSHDTYHLANYLYNNKIPAQSFILQTASTYVEQFNQVNLQCIDAAFTDLKNKKCRMHSISYMVTDSQYKRSELTYKIKFDNACKRKIIFLKIYIADSKIDGIFLGDCENGCK